MPKPCQCNRWGSGTTCEPSQWKSGTNKELDTKLQQMMAERAKLDTIWSSPTTTPSGQTYTQGKALQTTANAPSKS